MPLPDGSEPKLRFPVLGLRIPKQGKVLYTTKQPGKKKRLPVFKKGGAWS